MATGNLASGDSLGSLVNLLGMLKSSSSSSTTSSNISSAGMNQILQQILGGSQGLASVAQGQRSSGLYNSTTNQLLTNDLITRTAGELAKQQAGTTTTTKTPAKVSGSDVGMLALLGIGKNLLGPAVSGAAKKYGITGLGDKFADSLGLGTASPVIDSTGTNLFEGSGVTSALADFGSSLADSGAGNLLVDSAGSGIDAIGAGFSQAADSAASDVATNVASDEGTDFLSSLFG